MQYLLPVLKTQIFLNWALKAGTFVYSSPPHNRAIASPQAHQISLRLKIMELPHNLKQKVQLLHVCLIYGPPAAGAAAGMCLSAALPWSSYSSHGSAGFESSQMTSWTWPTVGFCRSRRTWRHWTLGSLWMCCCKCTVISKKGKLWP